MPRALTLMALAADKDLAAKGVKLYGVAQKDDPENLRRFLGAKGNHYAKIGLDPDGLTYFYGGRNQKLVGVEGAEPIHQII